MEQVLSTEKRSNVQEPKCVDNDTAPIINSGNLTRAERLNRNSDVSYRVSPSLHVSEFFGSNSTYCICEKP